jgi:hypothetical protein
MALTINPAVSRVSYRRWTLHVVLFVVGVGTGALVIYTITRVLYVLVAAISPSAWLAVTLPLIGLAALRDLGVPAPVPYPARRQVPEWLRGMLPPGLTAIAYGGQLGTGFLTRFTYSTHTAFVALLATQPPAAVVAVAVLAFALSKSFVVASSLAGKSYPEFEQRLLRRHRNRGQTTLRLANAALAVTAAAVLITNL